MNHVLFFFYIRRMYTQTWDKMKINHAVGNLKLFINFTKLKLYIDIYITWEVFLNVNPIQIYVGIIHDKIYADRSKLCHKASCVPLPLSLSGINTGNRCCSSRWREGNCRSMRYRWGSWTTRSSKYSWDSRGWQRCRWRSSSSWRICTWRISISSRCRWGDNRNLLCTCRLSRGLGSIMSDRTRRKVNINSLNR